MDNIDDILNNLSDYGKNILIVELIDFVINHSNYQSRNSVLKDIFYKILLEEMEKKEHGRK